MGRVSQYGLLGLPAKQRASQGVRFEFSALRWKNWVLVGPPGWKPDSRKVWGFESLFFRIVA